MARGERGKPARRTGTLGFRDKRCKLRGGAGEEDRPEANQIRREVAEAVGRIVREPRVSRLSAPNGGAGECCYLTDRASAAATSQRAHNLSFIRPDAPVGWMR